LFVVVIEIQAPEFLLRTILRRGVNFAFDLDALTKIDEQADFNAGRLEIVDKLGLEHDLVIWGTSVNIQITFRPTGRYA